MKFRMPVPRLTEDEGQGGPRCWEEPLPSDPRVHLPINKSQTEVQGPCLSMTGEQCSSGNSPLLLGFYVDAAVLENCWSLSVRDEQMHLLQR